MKRPAGSKFPPYFFIYDGVLVLLALCFASKYFFLRLVDGTSLNFHQYLMEDATRSPSVRTPFIMALCPEGSEAKSRFAHAGTTAFSGSTSSTAARASRRAPT